LSVEWKERMVEDMLSCNDEVGRPPVARRMKTSGRCLLAASLLVLVAGCASSKKEPPIDWPTYTLHAEQTTLLTPPTRKSFDASGLQFMPDGSLITIGNTHGATPYRINLTPGLSEATLKPLTDYFPSNAVNAITAGHSGRLDCEGLALDPQGRLYLCSERERWILRSDRAGRVERLPIDWSPVKKYFSSVDSNASFEGIAIGSGHLYVANERNSPVIIDVDLASLKVKRDFAVYPHKSSFLGLHYSDLCWFESSLWVLCRQHYVVLKVEPSSRRVLAEYDYRELEQRLSYRTGLPLGIMEGLAVDSQYIWLVTDNNGADRKGASGDTRPTLVKCRRPDLK
jgi:hypothetical protein